jgi:uncharacterized protein (DUF302 family)
VGGRGLVVRPAILAEPLPDASEALAAYRELSKGLPEGVDVVARSSATAEKVRLERRGDSRAARTVVRARPDVGVAVPVLHTSLTEVPMTIDPDTRYAWTIRTSLPFEAAVDRVTVLLSEQGFGVLTRIDVHEVLARKLGVQREPYVILGACNPKLANAALAAESSIGILLPCNVVVEARSDGSRVWVTRPEGLFALVDRDDLEPVVAEVSRRLRAVVDALAG